MVMVNTCVVNLGANKLYCTGNLHGKEYSFVENKAKFNVLHTFETYLSVWFQGND